MAINAGIDIGYNETKVKSDQVLERFASVVGTPDRARFSVNGGAQDIVLTNGDTFRLIGHSAVAQSRFLSRREDRSWIESEAYRWLMQAAFTELAQGSVELRVVTGLPIAFYDDKERLQAIFLGDHQTKREGPGRRAQTFSVTECRVIPQPFGALLYSCLDDRGRIVDRTLAEGAVGVIDIGGKTTNLLSAHRLTEIAKETASVNTGAWDVVRAVREFLAEACPDLDLRDHEIVQAIQARQTKYYGQLVDLTPIIRAAVEPMAEQIIAQAGQLWNSGARLDAILATGGGAYLLGDHLRRHFKHTRVVAEPIFANVIGYWRFLQLLNRQ